MSESIENPDMEPAADIEPHAEWALRKRRERMKVSRFQALAALTQAGLLNQVQGFIDQSTDPLLRLAWAEASFDRQSSMVRAVSEELGMTEDEVDQLFEAATKISI